MQVIRIERYKVWWYRSFDIKDYYIFRYMKIPGVQDINHTKHNLTVI